MQPTLVLFSGLPGTGKSVLAKMLARGLCWPLDENSAALLAFINRENDRLEPLPEVDFTPGKYHG
jgi:tRNA uridine 5-carbamoylmethylation protein Kti12